MSKGISIAYGDIAPEAKENFIASANESRFGNKYKENLQKYNMQLYDYANPCEEYNTLLDGTAVAFPSDPYSANIGLWSNQLSNDIGEFSPAIQLTLTSDGQYSTQGFTFTFDKFNNIYPKKIRIQWLRVTNEGTTDLGTKEFSPDNAFYFCRNQVENFNKVTISFISMNMPYSRLKVECIDFGYSTVFYGKELRNAKISQSISPISTEISINTCDFSLDSKTDMEYSFQAKQLLTVYFDDNLIATTFVKSSKRKAKFLWDIQTEDYIGLLDDIPFVGDIYTNKSAGAIFEEIFKVAKVPYSIDNSFYNVNLTGYIPYTNCRAALMQVAFASQAAITTCNESVVKVYTLDDDIKQIIPLERIMQGQSFLDENTVTSVELTYHTYKEIDDTQEAYNAEKSGSGDNITVKFSEPLHDLTITGGTIVTQGKNYAVINATPSCILAGKKYEHTQSIKKKSNPTILASELENVKSITNATLVSANNVDNVLEKCYNWLIRTNSTSLKIIEGKHVTYGKYIKWGDKTWGSFNWGSKNKDIITYDTPVNIGEKITAETEYLGNVSGRIIKQLYNLNGNILVKDTELK